LYSNNFWPYRAIHDLLTIAYLLTGAPPMTSGNVSDSPVENATPKTATIIQFPDRSKLAESNLPARVAADLASAGPTPEQRLARALESLDAALAEQRVAIAAWRDGLLALKVSTTSLHDNLLRYRTNLQTLGDGVADLHAKAQTLKAWADNAGASAD
jgi:hypothetical protein